MKKPSVAMSHYYSIQNLSSEQYRLILKALSKMPEAHFKELADLLKEGREDAQIETAERFQAWHNEGNEK
jgi:hypothetical protein